MRLVLATRNTYKQREFRRLLPRHTIEPLAPEIILPPEDGSTFAQNALGKAAAAALATGLVVIADDSGIEAAALGGAPGIRSARYAGPGATDAQNLAKLREEVAPATALAYVCAIAYCDPWGAQQLFEARCEGTMSGEPSGARGFGYDPVFIPDEVGDGRTMADLGDDEKDAISHRGRAARALDSWLT